MFSISGKKSLSRIFEFIELYIYEFVALFIIILKLLASERSERDTLSRSSMENAIRIYIYIYIGT